MKLRIILQDGSFIPQQYVKGPYSSHWEGFGSPILKFREHIVAGKFIGLVQLAAKDSTKKNTIEVVGYWPN